MYWYSLAYNNGICNYQPVISVSWKKNLVINGLYQKKGVLLPVLPNQTMNACLSEIADVWGIQKNLNMHCARHTFATKVTLTNKISMEKT